MVKSVVEQRSLFGQALDSKQKISDRPKLYFAHGK